MMWKHPYIVSQQRGDLTPPFPERNFSAFLEYSPPNPTWLLLTDPSPLAIFPHFTEFPGTFLSYLLHVLLFPSIYQIFSESNFMIFLPSQKNYQNNIIKKNTK